MKRILFIALAAMLLSLQANTLFAQNEEMAKKGNKGDVNYSKKELDPKMDKKADQDKSGQVNFPKMDVSPLDEAIYRDSNKEVMARVIYSRPQRRDREIFGKLVPYGKVWRTGANEATEVTLYKDMEIAGKSIKAGTYTLYTIPEQNEWTVILNNKTNTWGAFDYAEEQDQIRIKVPVRTAPTNIDSFSMAFTPSDNGAKLLMGWDNKYVEVPFTASM